MLTKGLTLYKWKECMSPRKNLSEPSVKGGDVEVEEILPLSQKECVKAHFEPKKHWSLDDAQYFVKGHRLSKNKEFYYCCYRIFLMET